MVERQAVGAGLGADARPRFVKRVRQSLHVGLVGVGGDVHLYGGAACRRRGWGPRLGMRHHR